MAKPLLALGLALACAACSTPPALRPHTAGPGEGEVCLAFVVDTLKPSVDSHYRTLTGRADTATRVLAFLSATLPNPSATK
jgi:hypothetical protein